MTARNTHATVTAETPIAIDQPATGEVPTLIDDQMAPVEVEPPADMEAPAAPEWVPDIAAINSANGDPHVWAHQFYQLVGFATGQYIDEQSLQEWLESFAAQVTTATFRSVMFSIANKHIPANITGDPALQLLQLRDDIARDFKHQAGL